MVQESSAAHTFFTNAAERAALVIGNSEYPGNPAGAEAGTPLRLERLECAKHDRTLMSNALKELGFEVELREDLKAAELKQAVSDFAERFKGTREVVFYYSGHGALVEGENYLTGVDTDPDLAGPARELEAQFTGEELDQARGKVARNTAEQRAVPLRYVLANLERMTPDDAPKAERDRHVRVVLLDACRSPFGKLPDSVRTKSLLVPKGGLGAPEGRPGMFIGFAAAAGQVALGDTTGPSIFTKSLVQQMMKPTEIVTMFKATRLSVSASESAQVPSYSDELNPGVEFSFLKGSKLLKLPEVVKPASSPAVPAPAGEAERQENKDFVSDYVKARVSKVQKLPNGSVAVSVQLTKVLDDRDIGVALGKFPPAYYQLNGPAEAKHLLETFAQLPSTLAVGSGAEYRLSGVKGLVYFYSDPATVLSSSKPVVATFTFSPPATVRGTNPAGPFTLDVELDVILTDRFTLFKKREVVNLHFDNLK